MSVAADELRAERDAARREAAEAREADAISRRLLARQCDLARDAETDRDAARRDLAGVVAADAANQRAQLDHAGLLGEFGAWIGCDLAEHLAEAIVVARGERDAARQTAEEYVRGLAAARVRADEAHERARAYAEESDRPAACGHRRGAIAYGDDGPHCPTCELAEAQAALADARAHHMDAPGGPRCACGLPSAHESGACRRCVALSAASAREVNLRAALDEVASAFDEYRRLGDRSGVDVQSYVNGCAEQARAPADRAALDALLAAERERCARIAESATELEGPWVSGPCIARRIRNPEGAP